MADVSYIINDSLKVKGNGESLYSTKDNKLLNASSKFYDERVAETVTCVIPQLLNQDGSYLGIFDQSITLKTNYDVPFTLQVQVNYYDPTATTHRYAYKAFEATIPVGTTTTTLLPLDISINAEKLTNKPVYVIPELKYPVSSFTVVCIFGTAPTTGETVLAISRRF